MTYKGPKDTGRADSLYRSAITKPDLDYSTQLLFAALTANPEHEPALTAILAKTPELAARRKISSRILDNLSGSPADDFLKSLAAYAAAPSPDNAVHCATESQKAGLIPHTAILADRLIKQLESAETSLKSSTLGRLVDALEIATTYELAVRATQWAQRAFPNEPAWSEREKNLMARKYLRDQDLNAGFRENLQDRPKQDAANRPADPASRFDDLDQHYRQSHKLEDFRELLRALREAPAPRRESALSTLQDGYERFGEKEILWFIREIKLQRRWAEVRLHQQLLEEKGAPADLRTEHDSLVKDVLREEIDHLYEVVSSLPPGPHRHKSCHTLTQKLFDAGRCEEAVKQAQLLKRKADCKLDALVIMAKSFVQLGLTFEAATCFEHILTELSTHDSPARTLDAKYSYAEFLTHEAEKTKDRTLALQARKLCAEVILEDIDYRQIRALSARADALSPK